MGGFTKIPKLSIGVVLEDLVSDKILVWNDATNQVGYISKEDLKNQLFPPEPNFDLTSPNWASEGVTDEVSFINWLETRSNEDDNDLTNIIITDFNFVGDRIFCNMTADGTNYELGGLGLVNADKIGFVNGLTYLNLNSNQIETFNPTIALPSSLQYLDLNSNQIATFNPTISLPSGLVDLYLNNNQIVTFNPTIPLPSSLTYLDLNSNQIETFNPTIALPSSLQTLGLANNQIATFNPTIALPSGLVDLDLSDNQMTTSSYTAMESWANSLTPFTLTCYMHFNGNIDSINGTTLKTILETKNCNVIA